jgi:hypothetical protein
MLVIGGGAFSPKSNRAARAKDDVDGWPLLPGLLGAGGAMLRAATLRSELVSYDTNVLGAGVGAKSRWWASGRRLGGRR